MEGSLRGKVVLVGIGNRDRADDGVGPYIAEVVRRMAARTRRPAPVTWEHGPCLVAAVSAGTLPEACVGKILACRPDTVLLVDAVEMGEGPGHVDLFREEEVTGRSGWDAHSPPLSLLMRYVAWRSGARVLLLGIQPADLRFGMKMTPAVRQSARLVARLLAGLPRLSCQSDIRSLQ